MNWDLSALEHPFKVLNFWSTLVDLWVNIHKPKVVSNAQKRIFDSKIDVKMGFFIYINDFSSSRPFEKL